MAAKNAKQSKAQRQAAKTRATRERRSGVSSEKSSPIDKADRKEKLTKVLIAAFALIMALSMVLPSLAPIFSNSSSEDASNSSTTEEDASGSATTTTTVADIDAQYQGLVDELEADLKENKDDLADILNLGNNYLQWAYQAGMYATTDEETAHVTDLYNQSISYYDRYLKLNDSPAAHVDRALAQYYSGSTDDAIAYLVDYTAADGAEYAPAWANLGMMYQYTSDTDNATTCYNKAMEIDPDDETGAYSYANSMLASMNSSSSSSSVTAPTDVSTSTSSNSAGTGLSDTLASAAGTSF